MLITGTIDGGQTLDIDVDDQGDLVITGAVGGTIPLTSTNFTGNAITLNGVRTIGTQTYLATAPLTLSGTYQNNSGPMSFTGVGVALADNVAITGGGLTDADDITITGEITGARDLSVTAGGTGTAADVEINNDVTNITSLAVSAHDIEVHNVFTSGQQLYTGTGIISLDGTYDSDTGNISFTGNSRLMSNTSVITRAGNDVLFTGTINGDAVGRNLTVNAQDTGDITISDNVGGTERLGTVTMTALNMNLRDVLSQGAQVFTIEGVGTIRGTYNSSANTGSITFNGNGDLVLAGATTISTSGGADTNDISIAGDITSSSGNQNLTLTASSAGDITVTGNIGGLLSTSAVGVFDVDGHDITLHSVRSTGNQTVDTTNVGTGVITINGDYISTGGLFNFGGNVTLGDNVTVNASGGSDSHDITFTGTIAGNQTLSLTTTTGATSSGGGDITLLGGVGGTTDAAELVSFTANGENVALLGVNTEGAISITARAGGNISPQGTYNSGFWRYHLHWKHGPFGPGGDGERGRRRRCR